MKTVPTRPNYQDLTPDQLAAAWLEANVHRLPEDGGVAKALRALYLKNPAAAQALLASFPERLPAELLAEQFVAAHAVKLDSPERRAAVAALFVESPSAAEQLVRSMTMPWSKDSPPPPAPVHNPGRKPSEEQKAQLQKELIAEVKKEGRFTDYTGARDEARRRSPLLFT